MVVQVRLSGREDRIIGTYTHTHMNTYKRRFINTISNTLYNYNAYLHNYLGRVYSSLLDVPSQRLVVDKNTAPDASFFLGSGGVCTS